MSGAHTPPPFDEKAAEDLFGFLPPQAKAEFLKAQSQHQLVNEKLANLANLSAARQNLMNQAYAGQALSGAQNAMAAQGFHDVMNQQCLSPRADGPFGLGQGGSGAFNPNPMSDQQSHDAAMMKMNPLARDRFEPVAKLLDIKIRAVNKFDLLIPGTEWVIQKALKDGRQIRYMWSVDDPGGGSFQHWKHMFDTLIDRCAELEGNDVPDHNTADTQSAGV